MRLWNRKSDREPEGCIAPDLEAAYGLGLFGELLLHAARAKRWLNRIAATVFGALALRLVMVQR